jgi:ABC-type uncharacterized transport system substrate-binding protein
MNFLPAWMPSMARFGPGTALLLALLAAPLASEAIDAAASTCSSPSFQIVSGVVAHPEEQVTYLRRALEKRGVSSSRIEMIVVDESDPTRIATLLDRRRLEGRTAVVTLSGHIAKALAGLKLDSPTVFVTIVDPVQWKIVDDLGKRQVNATGVTYAVDLEWKYLEYLNLAYPSVKRVGILADRFFFERPLTRRIVAEAPGAMGLKVIPFEADSAADLDRIAASPAFREIDAWIVPETPLVFRHEDRVLEFVSRRPVPNIFGHPSLLEKGALMTFGVAFTDFWSEAATTISMICAGADPRNIPVVRPHRSFLGVSPTNAARRGLPMDNRIFRLATTVH